MTGKRPKGAVPCEVCGHLLWYLVTDDELETFHLECRYCGNIGPTVNLEA